MARGRRSDGLRRRAQGGLSSANASSAAAPPPSAAANAADADTPTPLSARRDGRRSIRLKESLYPWLSRYRSLPGWTPNAFTAFVVLAFTRCAAAIYSGIADCDETFNYWEPLHFLSFGYGLQTWEYSPQFALRSYAYLLPFVVPVRLGFNAGVFGGAATAAAAASASPAVAKLSAFRAVRLSQAVVSAVVDTFLYDAVVWRFGKGAARPLLAFLAVLPGLTRASVELLPSSFAMIALSLSLAAWMVGEFTVALCSAAAAVLLGWPFVALLAAPTALHVAVRTSALGAPMRRALLFGAALLAAVFAVDSVFYGRLTLSPWNLVRYNVFGAGGEDVGPELYGVESWQYYVRNLALNLNVAAPLAALYVPLWLWHSFVQKVWTSKEAMKRAIFLSPAWPWLLVFFNQAHKEERFLAPAYPALCVVAAVTLDDLASLAAGLLHEVPVEPRLQPPNGSPASAAREPSGAHRRNDLNVRRVLYAALTLSAVMFGVGLSVSRTAAVISYYNAPQRAFEAFNEKELQGGRGPRFSPADFDREINICFGKEWYRFPSSFYLHSRQYRVRFVRSSFHGMLPMAFDEGIQGSRAQRSGFNEFNREADEQYLDDVSQCHYFVDFELQPSDSADNPIPMHARRTVLDMRMLDASRTPALHRALFLPGERAERARVYAPFRIFRNINALPLASKDKR